MVVLFSPSINLYSEIRLEVKDGQQNIKFVVKLLDKWGSTLKIKTICIAFPNFGYFGQHTDCRPKDIIFGGGKYSLPYFSFFRIGYSYFQYYAQVRLFHLKEEKLTVLWKRQGRGKYSVERISISYLLKPFYLDT